MDGKVTNCKGRYKLTGAGEGKWKNENADLWIMMKDNLWYISDLEENPVAANLLIRSSMTSASPQSYDAINKRTIFNFQFLESDVYKDETAPYSPYLSRLGKCTFIFAKFHGWTHQLTV